MKKREEKTRMNKDFVEAIDIEWDRKNRLIKEIPRGHNNSISRSFLVLRCLHACLHYGEKTCLNLSTKYKCTCGYTCTEDRKRFVQELQQGNLVNLQVRITLPSSHKPRRSSAPALHTID